MPYCCAYSSQISERSYENWRSLFDLKIGWRTDRRAEDGRHRISSADWSAAELKCCVNDMIPVPLIKLVTDDGWWVDILKYCGCSCWSFFFLWLPLVVERLKSACIDTLYDIPGGRFINVYELVYLRTPKFSILIKYRPFQSQEHHIQVRNADCSIVYRY